MLHILLFVITMKYHLNYEKEDDNYILLEQVFKIIDSRKSEKIIASYGVGNVEMFVLCLKIMFTAMFFGLDIKFIVNDLKNLEKLRNFFNIEEVPEPSYIYNYFSKLTEEQILKISNRILNSFKTYKNRKQMTYLVDATPVDLDFNIKSRKKTKEYLKTLDLKWSYSTSKGYYIGFKATVVVEYTSAMPVMILIHSGAPNDSKLFDEILKELKIRRIIRNNDILIFDRGYYSYNNYQIGVSKYKIIPFIFPKNNFKINKLNDRLSYPLEIFSLKKPINKLKSIFKRIKRQLLGFIADWENYKPKRGKIEDFFKLCKEGVNLKKIHKYTPKSAKKTAILHVFLAGILTTLGYSGKTDLQRLAES
jgi:hypothetical protein